MAAAAIYRTGVRAARVAGNASLMYSLAFVASMYRSYFLYRRGWFLRV